jgi:hypothetical protein
MSTMRYLVWSRKATGTVEFDAAATRAAARVGSQTREAPADRVGGAYWEALKASGVAPMTINGFAIHEGDEKGTLIATLHPMLEGAHATWLILYRADRDGSAFRALGNRQRLGDALDATFAQLAKELQLPHKP